ncbi:MAG: hemolysin family protein, partial [Oscillospiraceae bacterium]
KMIHNIFELDDKPVEDIMTHRTDIDILWLNDNIEKWTEFINETNHTRYPVCGNSIDDIVGVLNSRDFYKMLLCDKEPDLIGILRQPYFIPESIKADDLFSQMQNENTHFAIVLDEYGGFMGIVTQEDLLEEIVGELYSEYDEPEDMEEIVEIGEGAWKIQGSTELEAVSEALDIDICSDEYNTFAGMILDELGTIPEDGAVIELKVKNMEIKVTKIEEHRIEEAVVHLLEKPEDEPDDDED